MTQRQKDEPSEGPATGGDRSAELSAGLKRLAHDDSAHGWHLGTRLRNYFLTGLILVGPVTITIYIIWWFINLTDAWFKPFVPVEYLPDTYLPFDVPGIGLVVGLGGLTLIGALAANLLGRTLISYGELMLDRMPIVRNVYRGLKQIFESVVSATEQKQSFQKVGLVQFPSKGLWSIVFVTGETSGEIRAVKPGGDEDLLTVFMPTGIVPPTGFICFVPRKDVIILQMGAEDAAKIIVSAGMVTPDYHSKLRELADVARGQMAEAAPPLPQGLTVPSVPEPPDGAPARSETKAQRRRARRKPAKTRS